MTYTLTNTGSTSLSWTAGKTQPWLTLSKTSGTLNPGQTDSLVATLDPAASAALAIGTYTDTITFTNTTNGNGNTTRAVTLTVRLPLPAALSVSPAGDLDSTGPKGGPFVAYTITYTLTNTGDQPLKWTAGKTAKTSAWLTLSKTSGTLAPGATDTVIVAVDAALAAGLAAGIYTDTVTFTNATNGIGNTTRSATLTITAVVPGMLAVLGGGLTASGPQGGPLAIISKTYTVTNNGSQPIAWTATCTETWITLSIAGSTLNPGSTLAVTVSISAEADTFDVGDYTGTVTFTNTTNGNGDTTRPIKLIVLAPLLTGQLGVSPDDSMNCDGGRGGPFLPAEIVYTLTNQGSDTFDWIADSTQSWVTLSKTGGTLAADAFETVTVSVNDQAGRLARGTYRSTVTFRLRNAEATVIRRVWLVVGLLGDIDADGAVTILDALRLVQGYDVSEGQPDFDAACDLDGDGTITVADLILLADNFGKTE